MLLGGYVVKEVNFDIQRSGISWRPGEPDGLSVRYFVGLRED